MKPAVDHPWALSQDEAESWRSGLAARVDPRSAFRGGVLPRIVAVAAIHESRGRRTAAVVVYDYPAWRVLERAMAQGRTEEPFLPGAPTFQDAALLDPALGALTRLPDVLMVEGAGVADPTGFGLACHLGVRWGIPSFGVTKKAHGGVWDEPPPGVEGSHVFIKDGGLPVGLVVRTRAYRPPLFLSPGHRIDLMFALDILLSCLHGQREPAPLVAAHRWAARRQAMGRGVDRPNRRRKVL